METSIILRIKSAMMTYSKVYQERGKMKQFQIGENEAGQRFDKYLGKLLKAAPKSFFYKMLRKKNITLNQKKAEGNEILQTGDVVRLFISDDTFDKFHAAKEVRRANCRLDILYEDPDVILINKPAGMLSQPSSDPVPSLVEYLTGYLLETGAITEETLATFHPAVCNRLDRNTSGIVAAGKSLAGLQELSEVFRERSIHKDYLCLVFGRVDEKKNIKGYLQKDAKCNKVDILSVQKAGAYPIETSYTPLDTNGSVTLLKVRLVTGRTHQIRAHLASIGHPILGDSKYGRTAEIRNRKETVYGHQLLHAWRLEFPKLSGRLGKLSGRVFFAEPPRFFKEALEIEQMDLLKMK